MSVFPSGYSPLTAGTGHSGKLEVLFDMMHQLFTSTFEKIVLVSNYTQVHSTLLEPCFLMFLHYVSIQEYCLYLQITCTNFLVLTANIMLIKT